jgi:hypothetical protein
VSSKSAVVLVGIGKFRSSIFLVIALVLLNIEERERERLPILRSEIFINTLFQ